MVYTDCFAEGFSFSLYDYKNYFLNDKWSISVEGGERR